MTTETPAADLLRVVIHEPTNAFEAELCELHFTTFFAACDCFEHAHD